MRTVPVNYQIRCSSPVTAVGAYQICQLEALLGYKDAFVPRRVFNALLIPLFFLPSFSSMAAVASHGELPYT